MLVASHTNSSSLQNTTMGSIEAPLKRIHLNFFETACTGNHMCCGQWSSPGDNSRTKDRLDYWVEIAQLAEKGKITCIFFADTYAGHDIYKGNMDAVFRGGAQVGQLDPLVIISAMAVSCPSHIFKKEMLKFAIFRQ